MPRFGSDDPVPARLSIRLNEAERAAVEAVRGDRTTSRTLRDLVTASLARLAPGEGVRRSAGPGATASAADRAQLARATAHMGKVGSNLNQIARNMNLARRAGQPIDAGLMDALAAALDALGEAQLELIEAARPYARKPSVRLGDRILAPAPGRH